MVKIEMPEFVRPAGFGWIYKLYLNGQVVYVGQTIKSHPMARIGNHFEDKKFDSFSVELVELEHLSYEENKLIIELTPKYNKTSNPLFANQGHLVDQAQTRKLQHENSDFLNLPQAVGYICSFCEKRRLFMDSSARQNLMKDIPKFVENHGRHKHTRQFLKGDLAMVANILYERAILTQSERLSLRGRRA